MSLRDDPNSSIFVYGTLLLPEIQRRVTGREFTAREARVEGFVRRRVAGETYPTAVAQPAGELVGAVLTGVDAAALRALDEYEGADYERIPVVAHLADGTPWRAWMWLLRAAASHHVGDEPWDLETFVEHHLAAFRQAYRGFTPGPGSGSD
jgi:gamma-glutamylcyclotransferase (GGCT)/AIG2-like uncharacterized protein YtfP